MGDVGLDAEGDRDQVVRQEVTGTDLIFIQIGLTAIALTARKGAGNTARSDVPELYRRYLWLTLDGLRPRPDNPLPLPVDALSTSETHQVLTQPDVNAKPAR